MRFLNASVLPSQFLNRNLFWGIPFGNLLRFRTPRFRTQTQTESKRKRLGMLHFRTLIRVMDSFLSSGSKILYLQLDIPCEQNECLSVCNLSSPLSLSFSPNRSHRFSVSVFLACAVFAT